MGRMSFGFHTNLKDTDEKELTPEVLNIVFMTDTGLTFYVGCSNESSWGVTDGVYSARFKGLELMVDNIYGETIHEWEETPDDALIEKLFAAHPICIEWGEETVEEPEVKDLDICIEWGDKFHEWHWDSLPKSEEVDLYQRNEVYLARMITKSVLAWDEVENIGHWFFDESYVKSRKVNPQAIYGHGMTEDELAHLAFLYQAGLEKGSEGYASFTKDLVKGFIGNQTELWIGGKDGAAYAMRQLEYVPGYEISRGGVDRWVSYERIAETILDTIKDEFEKNLSQAA